MNERRRERIRELIRTLEAAQEGLHALLVDEENAFLVRTAASKETGFGTVSENAVDYLFNASTEVGSAIEDMQYAVGDLDLPEPVARPFKRRL